MVKEKDDIDDLISQAEMELSDSDIDKLIIEAESEDPAQPPEKEPNAIFPTASQVKDNGIAGLGKKIGLGALDALSLPTRALGSLQTNPETGERYKVSDVESNVFRPYINKVKSAIENMPDHPTVTTDKGGKAPEFRPMGSFGMVAGDKGYKEPLKESVEFIGGVAGDPTALVSPIGKIAKGASKIGNKTLGRLASELSGVSEETLRKVGTGFGKGAKELKNAAGSQKQIGEKLLDALDNFDQYLPEKQIVDDAIKNIPDVNISNTINKLNSSKATGHLKGTQQINKEIDDLVGELSSIADPNGNIPAQKFIEVRREIDDIIGDQFGKSTDKFIGAAKQARYQMAQDLIEAAKQSGNEEYVSAMKSFSDKLKLADELKGYVGKSSQVRDKRIESFISTLFGKNKSDRQRVVQGLGEIFGKDFLNESKLASMAAELGDEGVAGLLPRQFTGRSALGAALSVGGAGIGLGPASVIPAALSSPRIAAGSLATSDVIEDLAKFGANKANKLTRPIRGLSGISSGIQNSLQK